jgi:hypothetical protein
MGAIYNMDDILISICVPAVLLLAITGTAIIIKEIIKADGMYAGALAFNFVIGANVLATLNSVLILQISEMEMLEMGLVMIMQTIIMDRLGLIIYIMIMILMIVVIFIILLIEMGRIESRMGTDIITFLSSIILLLTKIGMEKEMAESITSYNVVLLYYYVTLIVSAVALLITLPQQPIPPIRPPSPLFLLTRLARLLIW